MIDQDLNAKMQRAVGRMLGGAGLDETVTQEGVPSARLKLAFERAREAIERVAVSAPVKRVGLALSGGGFRAAGFHLGVLDVMARADLLPRVKALSTVSGGSILAGGWIAALQRGDDFNRFFMSFAQWMCATNVVDEALRRMGDTSLADRPTSLIRAAAMVYSEDSHVGTLTFGTLRADLPFEDVMLNASEFHSGNIFRMTRTHSGGALFGNKNVSATREQAAAVRVADAVAASSCFPGAFEPLWWPVDFHGVPFKAGDKRVPLMDGGILDNQGVASLERALERHSNAGTPLDLLVVSDTHQHGADFMEERIPGTGFFSRPFFSLQIWWTLALLTALGLIGVGCWALVASDGCSPFGWIAATVGGVALGVWLAGAGLASWGLEQYPNDRELLNGALNVLTFPELVQILVMRIRSLLAILQSLFMKRARDQNYTNLREVTARRVRSVRVSINDYEEGSTGLGKVFTPQMVKVGKSACATPTTLWCSPKELRGLIAAGQISACARLREEFSKRKHLAGQTVDPATADALEDLWQQLSRDPYSLADERLGVLSSTEGV